MTAQAKPHVGAVEVSMPRHHQLIVSLFGMHARQHDGALQVAAIISLMQDVGVEPAGTRSSISRLKKRGIIESVQVRGRNGYSLSESVLTTFAGHGNGSTNGSVGVRAGIGRDGGGAAGAGRVG